MARKVFGSINMVPVRFLVEKAVDDADTGTHTVCVGDKEKPHSPERVKQTVACPSCGKTATSHYGFPDRGAENAQGELVVIDAEALAKAKGKPISGKVDDPVAIHFHAREKVFAATMYVGSVNNLSPGPGGEESYAYLHDYLVRHPDMVAAFTWAPRTKNTHWVIEATGDGRLVAYSLAYPESVRPTAAVPPIQMEDAKVALFEQVAELETVDFDPAMYANTAKAGVEALIESKVGVPMPTAATAPVGDMMAALQASVQAAKPAKKPATKKTAKKAPVRKAPVKKAVAKKTPAKATKRPAKKAASARLAS